MKFFWAWFTSSVLISVAYLAYAIIFQNILESPEDFGDLLSGFSAFVSLPSILIILIQAKKTDDRENKTVALQTILQIYETLDTQFNYHGHNLRYHLKGKPGKLSAPWDIWEDKDNIFGYLFVNYFSNAHSAESMEYISEHNSRKVVCENFCRQIESLINTLKQFNDIIDTKSLDAIENHQVIRIYNRLKEIPSSQ